MEVIARAKMQVHFPKGVTLEDQLRITGFITSLTSTPVDFPLKVFLHEEGGPILPHIPAAMVASFHLDRDNGRLEANVQFVDTEAGTYLRDLWRDTPHATELHACLKAEDDEDEKIVSLWAVPKDMSLKEFQRILDVEMEEFADKFQRFAGD